MKSKQLNKQSCFEETKYENEAKQNKVKEYYCIVVGFGPSAEKRYIPKSKKGLN